jgi:hypothetical protein
MAGSSSSTLLQRMARPAIREAACWADLRRDLHDLWKTTGSPIAKQAF